MTRVREAMVAAAMALGAAGCCSGEIMARNLQKRAELEASHPADMDPAVAPVADCSEVPLITLDTLPAVRSRANASPSTESRGGAAR